MREWTAPDFKTITLYIAGSIEIRQCARNQRKFSGYLLATSQVAMVLLDSQMEWTSILNSGPWWAT